MTQWKAYLIFAPFRGNLCENMEEVTKGPEKRRVFWPQLQELTCSVHQQFEDEIDDLQQKARLHMNFTLLLLFAINPGRAKEFGT